MGNLKSTHEHLLMGVTNTFRLSRCSGGIHSAGGEAGIDGAVVLADKATRRLIAAAADGSGGGHTAGGVGGGNTAEHVIDADQTANRA